MMIEIRRAKGSVQRGKLSRDLIVFEAHGVNMESHSTYIAVEPKSMKHAEGGSPEEAEARVLLQIAAEKESTE